MRLSLALFLCAAGCGSRSAVSDAAPDGPRAKDAAAARLDRIVADRAASDRAPSGADAGTYPQRIIRACVLAASCLPQNASFALNASRCIDSYGYQPGQPPRSVYDTSTPSALLAQRLLACADKSTDCKALHACFGGDWLETTACRMAVCVGPKLGATASGPFLDCAALSSTGSCVDLPTGAQRACCVQKPCPRDNVTCSGAAGGTFCGFGGALTFNCITTLGGQCNPDVNAPCVGTGTACSATQPATCNGSVATYCLGGRSATFDCAVNPMRSACAQGPVARLPPCAPKGQSCSPEFMGECVGNSITVCADGQRTTLDCRALGFEVCYRATAERPARCGMLL